MTNIKFYRRRKKRFTLPSGLFEIFIGSIIETSKTLHGINVKFDVAPQSASQGRKSERTCALFDHIGLLCPKKISENTSLRVLPKEMHKVHTLKCSPKPPEHVKALR